MKKLDLLKITLLNVVDAIDASNTNLDEDQCEEIIDLVNKLTLPRNKFSKYQSYKYLGLSRATFDRYVKDGIIPKSRKEPGFTEKFWYKEDLDSAKPKIKELNK